MLQGFADGYALDKKLLMPEEIASNIIHLASDEAKGMNGSIVCVDRGFAL